MNITKQNLPYKNWEYLHPQTGDRLRIIPERGGIISEWRCGDREVFYFDSIRYQDPLKSIRGGMPVLFPICGNLPGDIFTFNKIDYTLKQHGFARDLTWQLQLLDDDSGVRLTLRSDDKTIEVYPFEFFLEMDVRPILGALDINIRVHNTGKVVMPFSFGLHPYFKVSDLSKIRFTGLPERCFDHCRMIDDFTVGQIEDLSKGVDFLCHPEGSVTLIDELAGTTLELQNQMPMHHTVIWTDPPRKMVCLEPWTGPRQSLVSGEGKLLLEPGQCQPLSCRLTCN